MRCQILKVGLLLGLALSTVVLARPAIEDPVVPGRFIVYLQSPPVAAFEGERAKDGSWHLEPTAPWLDDRPFDLTSKAVVAYREQLAAQRKALMDAMSKALGHEPEILGALELTANAIIVDLDPAEVTRVAAMPGVKEVVADRLVRRMTDAGPAWVGAPAVWEGLGALPANLGEGVVVGIIDGGVNWDHDAFADPAPDGYDHQNPLGVQLGECSSPGVTCNDKLIGIYDFTNEGNQNGRDTDGHGTHVASTAVGNRRVATIDGITVDIDLDVSGVAPHANLVTYKVCRSDDPSTEPDEDGCSNSAIVMAIEQAVADGVPIVNMSLGGGPASPWNAAQSPMANAILNARNMGLLTVTSAGNGGPGGQSLTAPANAPWALAVANISHDRRFANAAEALSGGNTPPPQDLLGVGLTAPFGPARIVHAADFGNALCGAGDPELMANCEEHTGSSNPFAPGTFDGEIVVCDRGTYGRVEKGFNLRAAGAGGYILANTEAQGESIVGDDHCLPAVHIGAERGDELRAWLADGGSDHSGTIAGQFATHDPSDGDVLSRSSSRGPNPTASGTLKPEIAAPGSSILAAGHLGNNAAFLSGTSMASPHVAGAAALLLASNPDLNASDLHSILVAAARNEGMRGNDGESAAMPVDVGGGRLRVDLATQGGLSLRVFGNQFNQANPDTGGDPKRLNLPGLVDEACFDTCIFFRRVTAINGGGTWTASVESDSDASITVEPSTFSLADGENRELTITVDTAGSPALINQRVTGKIVLTPAEPDVSATHLVVDVFSTPGAVPERLVVDGAQARGSSLIGLAGLASLPDAAYPTLGLAKGQVVENVLPQDPTNSDAYDNLSNGVFFRLVTVDADGGLVLAETIVQENGDLDLFVGRDTDGDGQPDANEELCSSTSPDSSEQCILEDAPAGDYWILLQNWQASSTGARDASRIRFTALSPGNPSLLATGPGRPDVREPFAVRLVWNDGRMRPGETWFGALMPQAVAEPGQGRLGVIPVQIDLAAAENSDPGDLDVLPAYALAPIESTRFTLPGMTGHGRLFVDVPEGAQRLRVTVDSGRDVDLFVVRQEPSYEDAAVPVVSGLENPVAQETGAGGGHTVVIEAPSAGRYYVVPVNNTDDTASVLVQVALVRGAGDITPVQGLYFNPARNGAGFNLNLAGDQLIIQWYTYLEDGTPIWYFAQGPLDGSNQWHADLQQFRWNGSAAASTDVGNATLTFVSATDLIFTFRINGESGTEPYTAIVPDTGCTAQGLAAEQNGLWFIPQFAGSGYSILSIESGQTHINYLYDGQGFPRWVLGQGDPAIGTIEMSQFSGFCPTCAVSPTSSTPVGSNEFSFEGNASGEVVTEVIFDGTVPGQWQSSGALSNLTPIYDCEEG